MEIEAWDAAPDSMVQGAKKACQRGLYDRTTIDLLAPLIVRIERDKKLLARCLPVILDEEHTLRETANKYAEGTDSYRKWISRADEMERLAKEVQEAVR